MEPFWQELTADLPTTSLDAAAEKVDLVLCFDAASGDQAQLLALLLAATGRSVLADPDAPDGTVEKCVLGRE